MNIISAANYNEMSIIGAKIISDTVKANPGCVLGLATGTTPLGVYEKLASEYRAGKLDFSGVRTVNLDEYCGISPENKNSYRYFMNKNLFEKINIKLSNTAVPRGDTDDLENICREYDAHIDSLGGIDLQLLGIGHDGHIGFNEPSDHFSAGTHITELTPMTIKANSRLFESEEDVPKRAITMGIRSIIQSKKILMLVSGNDKKEILKRFLYGPITPQVPASILQLHSNVTVVTDIEL